MSLVAISTSPDMGKTERWPNLDPKQIIAATLVQSLLYVAIVDEKWDDNAAYIIAAASDLPSLIEEVLELRKSAGS